MRKIGLFAFLFMLVLASCRKDVEDVTITDTIPEPPVIEGYEPQVSMIKGDIMGQVVDELNQPVADALVQLGNQTVLTDAFGHFFFDNRDLNEYGTLVKVEKQGYFEGSRRFLPKANAQNRIKIELLEKRFDLSFNAEEGGQVNLPEGGAIDFNPNSIRRADGTLYSGAVQVAAKWMDPSALSTFDQMPGSLQGVGASTSNAEVALGTYGMMAVELESPSGEPLNIAEGATATLKMDIPASMQAGAPQEIILWSYHEDYGIWVEESVAQKEGGQYVGEVSHFSFWNCDIPLEYVTLTLTLEDDNGNPLPNALVVISLEDVGCGSGYTDLNGVVSGFVPARETLILELFDICGDVIYSEEVGPFQTDTDLGTIAVTNPNTNNTQITGELLCEGVAVSNGVIVASFDGQNSYFYIDGTTFDFFLTTCASTSTIEIQGFNVDDLTQSEVFTATPGTLTDLGTIDICEQDLDEFIELTVDGVTKIYPNPDVLLGITNDSVNNVTFIEVSGGNDLFIGFGFIGLTAGDYSNSVVVDVLFDSENNWQLISPNQMGFDSFLVSEYGDVGDFIIGTFEATLQNVAVSPPRDVEVSGSFKVINDL